MSTGTCGRPTLTRGIRTSTSRTRPSPASSTYCLVTAAALSPVSRATVLRATGPRSRTVRSTVAAVAARRPFWCGTAVSLPGCPQWTFRLADRASHRSRSPADGGRHSGAC
jgi:hypothetical protein